MLLKVTVGCAVAGSLALIVTLTLGEDPYVMHVRGQLRRPGPQPSVGAWVTDVVVLAVIAGVPAAL